MHMLVYLHEEGSISGAAKCMHLTQQAVSAQLKRLEELVGRPLVCRQNQRIELTPDGEVILLAARKMVDIANRIRYQFSNTTLDGFVRFGFTQGFSLPMLFALLSELRRVQPRLEVRCETGRTSQLLAKLEAGGLDVVLGAQADGNAQGEVMRRERLVWVGDLHHLVRPGMTIPLVVLPAPTFIREHIFDTLSSAGHKWTVHFESDDPASLRTAIRSGWGISLFNEETVLGDFTLPHAMETSLLPFPGHVEFFMRYNPLRNDALIRSFATVLRKVLNRP